MYCKNEEETINRRKMEKNGMTDSSLYEEIFQFKNRRSNHRFIAVLLGILTFFMGARAWWEQTYGGIVVDGGSMKQTFQNGDNVLMKYVDETDELKRGDIIIVDVREYPECGTTDFLIKRLIAVEGDKVKCVKGNVYICYAGSNAYEKEPLTEDYAYYKDGKATYSFDEYVVGEGEIFFLGDNRQNSMDSRFRELGGSHLGNKLYKRSDVYGVVPEWAIENMDLIEVLLFRNISKFKTLIDKK